MRQTAFQDSVKNPVLRHILLDQFSNKMFFYDHKKILLAAHFIITFFGLWCILFQICTNR